MERTNFYKSEKRKTHSTGDFKLYTDKLGSTTNYKLTNLSEIKTK